MALTPKEKREYHKYSRLSDRDSKYYGRQKKRLVRLEKKAERVETKLGKSADKPRRAIRLKKKQDRVAGKVQHQQKKIGAIEEGKALKLRQKRAQGYSRY